MLYLVVHHRKDPQQPWKGNVWLDDDKLSVIETTKLVARECEAARASGEPVRFHRCAYVGAAPVVCAEAQVVSVDVIDRSTSLVRFAAHTLLNEPPPRVPPQGTNSYRG